LLAQIRQPCMFAGSSPRFSSATILHRQSNRPVGLLSRKGRTVDWVHDEDACVEREKRLDLLCCTRLFTKKTASRSMATSIRWISCCAIRSASVTLLPSGLVSWDILCGPPAVPRATVSQLPGRFAASISAQYVDHQYLLPGDLAAGSGPLDCKHLPSALLALLGTVDRTSSGLTAYQQLVGYTIRISGVEYGGEPRTSRPVIRSEPGPRSIGLEIGAPSQIPEASRRSYRVHVNSVVFTRKGRARGAIPDIADGVDSYTVGPIQRPSANIRRTAKSFIRTRLVGRSKMWRETKL